MSTKLEELERRLKKAKELVTDLDRYCCGTACGACVLQERDGCRATQAKRRVEDLKKETFDERNRVKAIEDGIKTREEMTKAMMSVKRDDWEIVNIAYTEDDTGAVAFIKKGTELKKNMEPVKEKTNRELLFEAARKISENTCLGVPCRTCPMHVKQTNDVKTCIKPLVIKCLSELGEGENDNA